VKVITGNRLSDGLVVFLGNDGQWTPALERAANFVDDAAKTAFADAQLRVGEIADLYLIDVDDAGVLTGRETLRESIRKAGPTVRLDLGYQAGA